MIRRIIITLALLLAVIAMTACSSASANTTAPTDDSAPNSNQTVEPSTPGADPTNSPFYELFAHDIVVHNFTSIDDLETHLYTGSTDDADYSDPPNFDAFTSISGYLTHKYVMTGYLPLNEVFGIDPDSNDTFQLAQFSIPGCAIVFNFYFDDVVVQTIYLSQQSSGQLTPSSYYQDYCDYASKEYQPQSYEQVGYGSSGYVERNVGGHEIVYTVENGVPVRADFSLDKWLVQVSLLTPEDGVTLEQQLNAFMASDDFSAFKALFSNDTSALQAQLAQFEQKAEVVSERAEDISYVIEDELETMSS